MLILSFSFIIFQFHLDHLSSSRSVACESLPSIEGFFTNALTLQVRPPILQLWVLSVGRDGVDLMTREVGFS